MSQIQIRKNIYCQETGSELSLMYVNEEMIKIKVSSIGEFKNKDKGLSEQQLTQIGESLVRIIEENHILKERMTAIAKEYENNPWRDHE